MNLNHITVNTQSSIRIQDPKILYFDPYQIQTAVHEAGGVTIETIPAYNKLKPFHPKGKKWQGYVVEMDGVRHYVSGDTDVNEDIRRVRCDVALIPIGGFYTMDWKQALEPLDVGIQVELKL